MLRSKSIGTVRLAVLRDLVFCELGIFRERVTFCRLMERDNPVSVSSSI